MSRSYADCVRLALDHAGYERAYDLTGDEANAAARSAITEAVDRLTDAQLNDLAWALWQAEESDDERDVLRRALTEGT
jgi:hypothetical protein